MRTTPIEKSDLQRSVIAVPPLARHSDFSLNQEANERQMRHIEAGGVFTLLYGGNANFYHLFPSEYEGLLEMLETLAGEATWIIPSAGPTFGLSIEQAKILNQTRFPTAMLLPMQGVTSDEGVEAGFRKFVETMGRKAVLYIKADGYISVEAAARLARDGCISFIKYAVVREDPSTDPYLERLVDQVDPAIIVSGIGEQPALTHMTQFGLAGFTAGCVCLSPEKSQAMLEAVLQGDLDTVRSIQKEFQELEDLRNRINPIRVLHEAVTLAGIADMGPAMPLLSDLSPSEKAEVKAAVEKLVTTKSLAS